MVESTLNVEYFLKKIRYAMLMCSLVICWINEYKVFENLCLIDTLLKIIQDFLINIIISN